MPPSVEVAKGPNTDRTLVLLIGTKASTPSMATLCFFADFRLVTGLVGKRAERIVRTDCDGVVEVVLTLDCANEEFEETADDVFDSTGSSMGVFHNEPLDSETAGRVVT